MATARPQATWAQIITVILSFAIVLGTTVGVYASLRSTDAVCAERTQANKEKITKIEAKIDTILTLQWKIAAKYGITDATSTNGNLGVGRGSGPDG